MILHTLKKLFVPSYYQDCRRGAFRKWAIDRALSIGGRPRDVEEVIEMAIELEKHIHDRGVFLHDRDAASLGLKAMDKVA